MRPNLRSGHHTCAREECIRWHTAGSDSVSREGQKALVRGFVDEVISRGDLDLTDRLLASDYAYNAPGMEVRGPEGISQVFRTLRGAFPDWSETVEDLVAEGDRVVFRVTGRPTHRGEFMGIPPTGKRATVTGIVIFRLQDSRISEAWVNVDTLGMLQQLGVIPAAAPAGH